MPQDVRDLAAFYDAPLGRLAHRAIAHEILKLVDDRVRREKMIAEFDAVISKLGKGGANEAAARAILEAVTPAPKS